MEAHRAPWRVDLPVEPASVGRARRFALAFAHEHRLDGLSEDLALVTSELVSNAMRHARDDVTVVVLSQAPGEVRVEVSDDGSGQPSLGRPEPLDAAGRGLLIVDRLTSRWGTSAAVDGGKTVWAVLVAPGRPR